MSWKRQRRKKEKKSRNYNDNGPQTLDNSGIEMRNDFLSNLSRQKIKKYKKDRRKNQQTSKALTFSSIQLFNIKLLFALLCIFHFPFHFGVFLFISFSNVMYQ